MNEFQQVFFGRGVEMYTTPCYDCGESVKTWVRRQGVIFKCKECREREKEESRALKNKVNELTQLRRLEAAKEIIKKCYGDLIEYDDAFIVVENNIHRPGWFQSINEVLAAVELVRMKTRARHQVRMGKWRVDFLLPDLKVVLEIDGGYHKLKHVSERDSLKDIAIIAHLGPLWEMVRISDVILKQNPKQLVPAIKKVIAERQRLRKKHNGQLPANYSGAV